MGLLTTGYTTLLDVAKRMDPDNKVASVAEVLSATNDVLTSMSWKEGNLPTGNRVTLRSTIPTPDWRVVNTGVARKKSTTEQFTDTCGILELYADIDERAIVPGTNVEAYRASEDVAFMEGFSQVIADTIFYGNESQYPSSFTGLAPRYWDSSTTNCKYGGQVVKYGSGDGGTNTSLWFVTWGDEYVSGCYPMGSSAGLKYENKGKVTNYDGSGNPYEVYRSHFSWDCGLTIKDYRFVVRLCNLTAAGISGDTLTSLVEKMIDCYYKLPKTNIGRTFIYANAPMLACLHKRAMAKASNQITIQEWFGRPTTHFLEIPILRCDSILQTEADVA